MCCSEQHYPKDAGIWRTDACGTHVHYTDKIVEPEGGCPGNWSEHHWHAVTPLRITACVTYDRSTIGLKVQDWFRLDREDSMGGPTRRGQFDCIASIKMDTEDEKARAQELILLAIAEGYDWTKEALQNLLPRAKITWQGSNRAVNRPEPPSYEQWLRWNTFVRPAHNDLLYDAEMGHEMKFSGLDRQVAIVDGEFDIEAWHKSITLDQQIDQQVRAMKGGTVRKAPATQSGWKPLAPTAEDVSEAQKRLLEAMGLRGDEDA